MRLKGEEFTLSLKSYMLKFMDNSKRGVFYAI